MDYKLTLVKGDTLAFGFEVEGITADLDTAVFSCKANPADDTALFEKDLDDGISKVSTGKYRVRVDPDDTSDIEAGRYWYKLTIGLNDDVFTILKGALIIEP